MEGTIYIIALMVVLSSFVAILWSIGRGIRLLRQTYVDAEPDQRARRILAWNLIEPGLTVPNVFIGLTYSNELMGLFAPLGLNPFLAGGVLALWPMLLLFVIWPAVASRSSNPRMRWAARKTAKLGIIRMVITVITVGTYGLGTLVGIPYLFWSLKKIREWNEKLLWGHDMVHPYSSRHAAAIVGGKQGMLVTPHPTTVPNFKVLLPKQDANHP